MCNVKEMLWLKRRIIELEDELAEVQSIGTIDIHLMSSILLDKLEEMGDDKAELYLADVDCKVFKKDDVLAFLDLNEIDKIEFIPEEQDCDDFAAALYSRGIGIVWTEKHALNWAVLVENSMDDEKTLYFIEPQTDLISKELENWQGWDARFFLSR